VKRSELEASVAATLRRVVPAAPEELDPDRPLRDQAPMDSLDFLNFVLALEKEHGVQIREVRYPMCANLRGAVEVLADALEGVEAASG
jgi:acyl carrier protein